MFIFSLTCNLYVGYPLIKFTVLHYQGFEINQDVRIFRNNRNPLTGSGGSESTSTQQYQREAALSDLQPEQAKKRLKIEVISYIYTLYLHHLFANVSKEYYMH